MILFSWCLLCRLCMYLKTSSLFCCYQADFVPSPGHWFSTGPVHLIWCREDVMNQQYFLSRVAGQVSSIAGLCNICSFFLFVCLHFCTAVPQSYSPLNSVQSEAAGPAEILRFVEQLACSTRRCSSAYSIPAHLSLKILN